MPVQALGLEWMRLTLMAPREVKGLSQDFWTCYEETVMFWGKVR